jgi:membrane protease YdiL (CAAX protease family)
MVLPSSTLASPGKSPIAAPTRFHPGRVVGYFLLAYAISWAWVIPWAATGHTVFQGDEWPTHFPSLMGPMLAAFVVTAWTTGAVGMRELLARMGRWRIGWLWWLAVVSPLVFFVLVLGVMVAVGADIPSGGDFARFSGVPVGIGFVGLAVVVILVNGFGEEVGWRGYALPQLQHRFSPLAASLIIAVFWVGWHIPQFWFLDSYKDFSAAMLPVFVFGLASGSIVLTWIYNRTGSILAVAVWHGLYNVTGATKAATGASGAIASAMWTLVVLNAIVLIVLERRAHRAGRPSILGAP